MEKLKKMLKKVNKRSKKCHRHKESDINSDSSRSVGSGSTGEIIRSSKKVKISQKLTNYTTSSPIKTTNTLNFNLN